MGQYDLPRKQPMTPGVPPVSPSSRAAHAILDTSVKDFAHKNFPQYEAMVPPDKAKLSVREALKGANFLEKQLFMSKLATALPKGVTTADIEKAVNEPAPPPEAPAAPAAPPPAASAAPAPAAPATAAPAAPAASAAPAPAASQYALPQAPPAAKGPTVGAAAAMPQGASSALDYIAKYGGHASVLRDGKIVPVHPGTAGAYTATNPELAARLAAAGQAYQRETGQAPQYGEMSRGADVQSVYYNRYKSGEGGIAAAPGNSQHQKGGATDLPSSGFRDWLYKGNMDRFGLHFPVKGDTPHVQINPAFKGTLATGTGTAAGTPDAAVQAGAGPAAVAAARARDTAPAAPVSSGGGGDPRKAFLATIATGEAPKGAYGMINGRGTTADLSKHPGGVAGQYQFKDSTWAEQAAKYGYKDFKPETQDTAAWNYAKDVYKTKSGRDLETDLKTGDPTTLNNISKSLAGTWTSLPGGAETNSNWKNKDFASVYKANLGTGNTAGPLDPTPNIGSGASDYDKGTSFPNVDPTPNAGSGASDYGGGAVADAGASAGGGMDFGKGMGGVGDLFSGLGDIFGKGPVAQNAATKSGPANLPLTVLPTPPDPMPMIDPKRADAQRQLLAAALQRLNSGRLV